MVLFYHLVTDTGLFFHTVYKDTIFYYLPYLKSVVYIESVIVFVLGSYLIYFLYKLWSKIGIISRMLYDGELLGGGDQEDCPICLENLL